MGHKSLFCAMFICANMYAAVHSNQVGYYSFGKKVATITDSSSAPFSIMDVKTKEVVYTGVVVPQSLDKTADEFVSVADFTPFSKEGEYYLNFNNKDTSYHFSVGSSCYRTALDLLVKSYFFQRAGLDLDIKYADVWNRAAGHLGDSALTVFESSADRIIDVRGGWYDAGDFGKYVVNAGITCGTLLGLYELCPEIIDDSSLNIPESKNGVCDLLDEVKYELDWLIRMQDSDGGVFFKVGPVEWYGSIMPAKDFSKRFIIGKSTTSTLNFAAVMAMAGRVYQSYDSSFSRNCTERAEKAWNWAVQNPRITNPPPQDGTGPYEDGGNVTYRDEFFWALSELAATTKKPLYKDSLEKIIYSMSLSKAAWWQDVKNLGFFSLAINKVLSDSACKQVRTCILTSADKVVTNIQKSPYMNPLQMNDYTWGSTGLCGNYAVIAAYAHHITNEQKYLDAMVLSADYLLGRNPLGTSYVTGLGTQSPENIHHRQSRADNVSGSVPGFVVGGANSGDNGGDIPLSDIVEFGTPAAKCFIDDPESWASNENAINQNAPWILVLGYLQEHETVNRSVSNRGVEPRHIKSGETIHISQRKSEILLHFNKKNEFSSVKVFNLRGQCLLTGGIRDGERSISIKPIVPISSTLIVALYGKNSTLFRKVRLLQ